MATNNNKPVTGTQGDTEPKTKENGSKVALNATAAGDRTKTEPKTQESTYTAAELAKAHKTLGASYEIVVVALKQAGKARATVSEAKEIVERFKTREVK